MARIHEEIEDLVVRLSDGEDLPSDCVRSMIRRIDSLNVSKLMSEEEGNLLSKRLIAAGRRNDMLRKTEIPKDVQTTFWGKSAKKA